jgi:hypothetical protein
LTSMLLSEAGFCYINGVYYATTAMCQAAVESVLRREAGGYRKEYWRLVRKLREAGRLTARESKDLLWLASVRNPTLHTGSNAKYTKALSRGVLLRWWDTARKFGAVACRDMEHVSRFCKVSAGWWVWQSQISSTRGIGSRQD